MKGKRHGEKRWLCSRRSTQGREYLRRLAAIELKLGKFEAADKGQMELYLAWLKKYACEPDEAAPLGMILCAGTA